MAQRGRKPKPTALKVLEGNPGQRRLNVYEPKPTSEIQVPDCPDWLIPEAALEWNRLAGPLIQMGVLTGADMAAFAGYCQNYARWKEAEEHLTEEGPAFEDSKGKVQHSPYLRVSEAARRDMLRFASEFGLTPSSRSRIVATTDPGENFSGDPMEALLREG